MSETEQAPASGGVDAVDTSPDALNEYAGVADMIEDATDQLLALSAHLLALSAEVIALRAQLTALRARVEEAERDTARIDWMIAESVTFRLQRDRSWYCAVIVNGNHVASADHGNLRTALDEARAALSSSPTPRTEP